MKMYLKATHLQRFVAFLVDFGLVYGISYGICYLILFLTNYDFARYNALYDSMLNDYYQYMLNGKNFDQAAFMEGASELLKLMMIRSGVMYAIGLVLIIGYLVILPKYWKKQTLGRALTRTKVISHKPDTELTFGQIIRRELLGTFLFYFVFASTFSLLFLLVLVITGRSIADVVANADLVMDTPIVIDQNRNGGFYSYFNGNNQDTTGTHSSDQEVKADYKELDPEEDKYNYNNDNNDSNNKTEEPKKEKKQPYSSDDEYDVF